YFGKEEEIIKTGNPNTDDTNYNGGHLVGDQVMDSHNAFNLYEDWNLAPQQKSFNNPVYLGTIENAVTRAISAGATIKYTVTVQYPDNIYQIKPSVLIKNLLPSGD
ncbi:MAG: DNA/RNA non-specific endonuclease, partial [Sphaerospermopsis kisseleviana]